MSQFAKPALQMGNPQPVLTQVGVVFANVHWWLPQTPQWSAWSRRVSQPTSDVQSPQPTLQPETLHFPCSQAATVLGSSHEW